MTAILRVAFDIGGTFTDVVIAGAVGSITSSQDKSSGMPMNSSFSEWIIPELIRKLDAKGIRLWLTRSSIVVSRNLIKQQERGRRKMGILFQLVLVLHQ